MKGKNNNNNGKEILKLLQENYNIESAQDLSSVLKDMFKRTLQNMINTEFDSFMGYSKYDKSIEKTKYRNDTTRKNLKANLLNLALKHLEIKMEILSLKKINNYQIYIASTIDELDNCLL